MRWGGDGRLFQGWALIKFFCLQDGRLFEVGANNIRGWALIRINTGITMTQ